MILFCCVTLILYQFLRDYRRFTLSTPAGWGEWNLPKYSLPQMFLAIYPRELSNWQWITIHSPTKRSTTCFTSGMVKNTSRFNNSSVSLLCIDSVPVSVPTENYPADRWHMKPTIVYFFKPPTKKLRSIVSLYPAVACESKTSAHQNSNAVLNILPRKRHSWNCLVVGSVPNYT